MPQWIREWWAGLSERGRIVAIVCVTVVILALIWMGLGDRLLSLVGA